MSDQASGTDVQGEAHLSIGEVLHLLQDDFPDVTISKIRFLESQGLIDPERTPSGYRKFYGADIERLRWILQQQREHFLPLRVIKDRLDANEAGLPTDGDQPPAPPAPPAATPPPAPRAVVDDDPARLLAADDPERRWTVDQLAKHVGLTHRQLGELERYGLVVGESVDGTTLYGADAVEVAELCRAFIDKGVEPRHLRMFKLTAEREAAFLDQLLLPHARRKGRAALREALGDVAELAAHGARIRMLMLRDEFRDDIDRIN